MDGLRIMRSDEKYVNDSLERYLSKIYEGFETIEDENPPDFYVKYNNKKILLEVSRTEPVYYGEKVIKCRNTIAASLIINLCSKLDNELGLKIASEKAL